MENATDEEIDLKVQKIMKKLQLPEDLFNKFCLPDFYEALRNPKLSAQIETAINREVRGLMQKIYLARDVLENSAFYAEFMDQMLDPEMLARIKRVTDTDPDRSHLQMVFYGIGAIDPESDSVSTHERSQIQLAFALLLKEKFELVDHILVYDPLMSRLERTAISRLGCTVSKVDEDGKRTVDMPTLFFMPYCPVYLHDNVLQANWTPANLNKIIIICKSFHRFPLSDSVGLTKLKAAVESSGSLLHEVPLPPTEVPEISPSVSRDIAQLYGSSGALTNLSWHFFNWDGSSEELNKLDEPYI